MDLSFSTIGCIRACVIKVDRSMFSLVRDCTKFMLEIEITSIGEFISSGMNQGLQQRGLNKPYAIEMRLGLAHHSVQDHLPSVQFNLKGLMVQKSNEAKRLFQESTINTQKLDRIKFDEAEDDIEDQF